MLSRYPGILYKYYSHTTRSLRRVPGGGYSKYYSHAEFTTGTRGGYSEYRGIYPNGNKPCDVTASGYPGTRVLRQCPYTLYVVSYL